MSLSSLFLSYCRWIVVGFFFFSSRRRHTRCSRDWSSDVCSSDLWPINRRIIYNRASVDLDGNPRDPKRPLLKWDSAGKAWVGDVPDNAVPPMGTTGAYPFIMKPDGVASILGPGLKDGPFPEHYEPLECPIEKNLISSQRINPVIKVFEGGLDTFLTCDPRYPFVCSTYRATEHWQPGVLTRWLPWLIEAEPQVFYEMSMELRSE